MSKLSASSAEFKPSMITTTIAGVPESITRIEDVRRTPAGQLVAKNPLKDVRNFEKGTTPIGKGRRKTKKRGGKKRTLRHKKRI
jgi:hypothetical protein